ncbi:branched-chain amino acid permease [Rhodovibrio sodomensis]|uniref:Branched-chain amino acid permease n=1 Tax=Rhodovibrio sodomensis TaxID=1088 RepID=A0ABS1DM30_9PROT|nr:AzlC family ABC transporter permease [Rhodovibrio sodomensis]MBK1671590.1 branched-chain amino acid permease [Rhodovibrio sodomensis]
MPGAFEIPDSDQGFGGPRAAARAGLRQAFGAPGLVLSASFLGFGALVRQSDLALWHGVLSTVTGWALPGQIALVELYAAGASLLSIALAVALSNARLLPMTVTLVPVLRAKRWPRWSYFLAAHYIAVTGWAAAMRVCPAIPPDERLPYFTGFTVTLWTGTIAATAIGFYLAGAVPQQVSLGLVFLNPIYFMLVFAESAKQRMRALALGLGAVAGPAVHLLSPDWGLLISGVGAGTLAYALDRLWARRHA